MNPHSTSTKRPAHKPIRRDGYHIKTVKTRSNSRSCGEVHKLFAIMGDPRASIMRKLNARIKLDVLLGLTKD